MWWIGNPFTRGDGIPSKANGKYWSSSYTLAHYDKYVELRNKINGYM